MIVDKIGNSDSLPIEEGSEGKSYLKDCQHSLELRARVEERAPARTWRKRSPKSKVRDRK